MALQISSILVGLLLLQQGTSMPLDAAVCPDSSPFSTCNKDHYTFAVLGDSFASGVSYKKSVEYDHNKDSCWRSTDTHGVQMKNNNHWTTKGIRFDFAACSGTRMVDMAKGQHPQINQTSDPDLVIMTIGGNNAGFFDVVDGCVYHSNFGADYGPPYDKDPQRKGKCAQAIDFAKNYISSEGQDGFKEQLRNTYNSLLTSEAATSNPELRFYQTGYVHYFNVEPDGDWCNTTSFLPSGPTLSRLVRQDINDLVETGNRAIKEVTMEYANRHVGYVSITEDFDQHRFCEGNHQRWQEYLGEYVWLWNISPPGFTDSTEDQGALSAFLANPSETRGPYFEFSSGNSSNGYQMRPFHPKRIGYESIMNSTISQLRADRVPGIKS